MKRFAITWELPNGQHKTKVYRTSGDINASRYYLIECGEAHGLKVSRTA
jgi:hypothetical protein